MAVLGVLLKNLPTILPIAVEAVKFVERMFGKNKGAEKRSVVVSFVRSVVLAAEGIKGSDIVDEDVLSEGIGDIVDGIVKVLNSTGKFDADNIPE